MKSARWEQWGRGRCCRGVQLERLGAWNSMKHQEAGGSVRSGFRAQEGPWLQGLRSDLLPEGYSNYPGLVMSLSSETWATHLQAFPSSFLVLV